MQFFKKHRNRSAFLLLNKVNAVRIDEALKTRGCNTSSYEDVIARITYDTDAPVRDMLHLPCCLGISRWAPPDMHVGTVVTQDFCVPRRCEVHPASSRGPAGAPHAPWRNIMMQ